MIKALDILVFTYTYTYFSFHALINTVEIMGKRVII